MSIKRPLLVNNEIYHIILRGVADSLIFKDRNDYYRGIFSLYEFNDINPVLIRDRRRARLRAKKKGKEQFSANRDMFVEILAFYFMPNHTILGCVGVCFGKRKSNEKKEQKSMKC